MLKDKFAVHANNKEKAEIAILDKFFSKVLAKMDKEIIRKIDESVGSVSSVPFYSDGFMFFGYENSSVVETYIGTLAAKEPNPELLATLQKSQGFKALHEKCAAEGFKISATSAQCGYDYDVAPKIDIDFSPKAKYEDSVMAYFWDKNKAQACGPKISFKP